MRQLLIFTLLLVCAPLGAQWTKQNPAGAWKNEQLRLILHDQGDFMTYAGFLEVQGKQIPLRASRRLFGTTLSGAVASRVKMKAKLENGQIRLTLGEQDYLLSRDASYQPPAPQLAPAAVEAPVSSGAMSNSPWVRRLSGMKLQQMSLGQYDRQHKVWILFPNGTFSYSNEYGGAVYSGGGSASMGGRSGNAGTWRVVDQGGRSVLILNYRGSGEKEYELSANSEGHTFLNGVRTYVTPPNEG